MSARDRQKKVEQYAIENQQLRRAIGTLTKLNAEFQEDVEALKTEKIELIQLIKDKFPWTPENEPPRKNYVVWLCFREAGARFVSQCYVDDCGDWRGNVNDRFIRNPICWTEIYKPKPPEEEPCAM